MKKLKWYQDKEKWLQNKEFRVNKKIDGGYPLSEDEIAFHYEVDEKIIRNIFFMYENFGRDSIESITFSQDEIDQIIKFKLPWLFKEEQNE